MASCPISGINLAARRLLFVLEVHGHGELAAGMHGGLALGSAECRAWRVVWGVVRVCVCGEGTCLAGVTRWQVT